MLQQINTPRCNKCGHEFLYDANYCSNCGNGLKGKSNSHLSTGFMIYLKAIIIYSMIDSLIWISFSEMDIYSKPGFSVITNTLSYISRIIWFTFPMVFALLMPKNGSSRTLFIVLGAVFLAFRIGHLIYLEFIKVPFVHFEF